MNRKTLVLPAVLGLLAPVLAACGGSDSGGQSGDAIVVGTTDRFIATSEAPAPLDPAYAYDVGPWNVLRQVVQTLMSQPRGGGDPEPDAAESCGFTDSGNERYACKLRKGLKFANGDAVTAADVKFSIDRARSINADSGVAGLLSTVDTVETQGDNEVIFHLKTADATFPFKLSTPVAGILSSKDYEKNKLRDGFQIDGSGPYTMKADVKGDEVDRITFSKNPNYKGLLTLKNDQAVLEPFKDPDAMSTALDKGDIDVASRGMTPDQVNKLQDNPNGKVNLVEVPGLVTRYLGFKTTAPVVKSKAVRQAMAQVIDRDELVSKVYGSQAQSLYSLVPATVTGHSNSFFNKYGTPSVDKARNLLAKEGITTPVKLTLNYTTDHYGETTAAEFKVLEKQLNDSGLFDVDIKGTSWDKYRPAELKGQYEVFGMGWFPDFPDADTFIAPVLDKKNFLNSTYVNNEIRNTLIPQSRREADRLAASKSITQIQDIVAEDVPVIPLWQGKQYVAIQDDIMGGEYAMSTSSTLQLWELSRGVSG
ncbi:ABC transporter substrate-binding protein [Streptomyces sp. NPDC052051]|uniref:ABC transporter substrate-binding protein n=1 Tax=Streptomyces sp. NPDC052051 TaxID=3154649 RepID=UPI00343FE213